MLSEQGRTVDAEFDGAVDDTVAALHLVDDDPVLEAQLVVLAGHAPHEEAYERHEHRNDAREQKDEC